MEYFEKLSSSLRKLTRTLRRFELFDFVSGLAGYCCSYW